MPAPLSASCMFSQIGPSILCPVAGHYPSVDTLVADDRFAQIEAMMSGVRVLLAHRVVGNTGHERPVVGVAAGKGKERPSRDEDELAQTSSITFAVMSEHPTNLRRQHTA